MNDTHNLLIKNFNENNKITITVSEDAWSVVKRFEAKKLSGSPFIVTDVNNTMWAFDVELIEHINIDNVVLNAEPKDSEE